MSDMPRAEFDALEMRADRTMALAGKPFTGVAVETRPDGSIMSETTFVDGAQSGASRHWSPQGRLLEEDHFWNGSKHGICRSWHDNGGLAAQATYEYSIKTKHATWDAEGHPLGEWTLPSTDPNFEILVQLRNNYDAKSAAASRRERPE